MNESKLDELEDCDDESVGEDGVWMKFSFSKC
jgi:hypothetical protein